MSDNKGFWDVWAKRYDTVMSKDGKTYEKLIGRMKKVLTRNMTALELACGTGLFRRVLKLDGILIAPTFTAEDLL